MKKPISRPVHGAIDYAYAVLVPAIPQIAGFKNQKKATMLCKLLGAGALTYTALTKAEWGLYKFIPFKTHLMIDLSVSILAAGAPWLLGFASHAKARNAVLAIAAAGITASLLTEDED